jgi:1-acyl-sn-glycerol-3-phosphate acyltransferase
LERYFLEPYRFIPPFRGTFWCRLGRRVVPRHLRRKMGVIRFHDEGLEHFRHALEQKAGILLACNHCRWADPMVLGVMAWRLRHYLYYVASYHLFRQSRFMGWVLNRLGGYSIWREGSDRESIRVTARILADAERPVVIFPEGTWFRQNDRVAPLQEGLTLITRQAARQTDRPLVVLPVALKYWMLQDPRPEIARRLERLERRIGWQPQGHLELIARLEKLGTGLLAVKEVEYLGEARTGPLDERIAHLVGGLLERLEDRHLGRRHHGWALERIRRLRQQLSRRLLDLVDDPGASTLVKRDLESLLCLENINAQSLDYLRQGPSPERLVETVQRIEETVTDTVESPVVPMGVTIRIGPAIDARADQAPGQRRGDSFVQGLREQLQGLVNQLVAQGPPASWAVGRPAWRMDHAVRLALPALRPTPHDSLA